MKWRRDQWVQYFIVLVVTIGVLFCGQLIWHKYAVAKPLDKELLQIKGVESVQWEDNRKDGDGVVITVALGPVVDLENTYGEIGDTVKRIMGHRAVKIVLREHRTPELENVYYKIHYQVQEAISTGKFVAMADNIQAQAKASQVDAKVYVDARYVYIELDKGVGRLYSVVPRQADNQEVN